MPQITFENDTETELVLTTGIAPKAFVPAGESVFWDMPEPGEFHLSVQPFIDTQEEDSEKSD